MVTMFAVFSMSKGRLLRIYADNLEECEVLSPIYISIIHNGKVIFDSLTFEMHYWQNILFIFLMHLELAFKLSKVDAY